MKNLLLGILIGVILYGQAAKALEISFDQITIKDLYAACALSGTISSGRFNTATADEVVAYSWLVANKMVEKRNIRR